MLKLNINATGVDYHELLSIIDEIKKHLEAEMTLAHDVREDNSGEYNLEVTGSEEITSERFVDSMTNVEAENVLFEVPSTFTQKSALYYSTTLDAFIINDEDHKSIIAIDCPLEINEEAMKATAYNRLFETLGYTGNFDHVEATQDIEENHMDDLLEEQGNVYNQVIGQYILDNADFGDFVKNNPKEASEYAVEKDWL